MLCMGACASSEGLEGAIGDEEEEVGEEQAAERKKGNGQAGGDATLDASGLSADDSGPCELYVSHLDARIQAGRDGVEEEASAKFRLALYVKGGAASGSASQWWVADRATCTPNRHGQLHTPLRPLKRGGQGHIGPVLRLPRGLGLTQHMQLTVHAETANSTAARSLGVAETTVDRLFRAQDRALTLSLVSSASSAVDRARKMGSCQVELHLTPVALSRGRRVGARKSGAAALTFEALRENKLSSIESEQDRARARDGASRRPSFVAADNDFRINFEAQRERVAMAAQNQPRRSEPSVSFTRSDGSSVPRLSLENVHNRKSRGRSASVPEVSSMYYMGGGAARISKDSASRTSGFLDDAEVAKARSAAAGRGRRRSYSGNGQIVSGLSHMAHASMPAA